MAKIVSIRIIDYDNLSVRLDNGQEISFYDGVQSCCEHRYMSSDDNPEDYIGAEYRGYDIVECSDGGYSDGGYSDEYYYVHDIQFLNINTSVGVFQVVNHNEHNGYYGGFIINVTERSVGI